MVSVISNDEHRLIRPLFTPAATWHSAAINANNDVQDKTLGTWSCPGVGLHKVYCGTRRMVAARECVQIEDRRRFRACRLRLTTLKPGR
jgi:hypothetical protein